MQYAIVNRLPLFTLLAKNTQKNSSKKLNISSTSMKVRVLTKLHIDFSLCPLRKYIAIENVGLAFFWEWYVSDIAKVNVITFIQMYTNDQAWRISKCGL